MIRRWLWRRLGIEVGVAYCTVHHGVLNEDDRVCDFAYRDDDDLDCEHRPLAYAR